MNAKIVRRVRWPFYIFLSVLTSGCAVFDGMPDKPETSTSAAPAYDYLLGPNGVAAYNAEKDLSQKKVLRNELIDARMAAIDRKFQDFERALYAEGIGYGVGTQWTLLALTAASTISRVTNTKTAISAVATAVAGGNAVFSKEALFDKTMPVLMAQMQAERQISRAQIRARENLSVEQYSWYAAESDLIQFEFAGSIPGAINAVAKDAGQKATVAQNEMETLTKGTFRAGNTRDVLRSFWRPNGSVSANNEAEIVAWMKKNNFDTGPGSITMFISSAEQEEARNKAIKDLGLPR